MTATSTTTKRLMLQRSLGTSIRGLCRSAYRFVFPPTCPLCHNEVDSASCEVDHQFVTPILCESCSTEIIPPPGNRCLRCGVSLGPYVSSEQGCPMCQSQQYRFGRVIRLGTYEGLLRDACIRGKASHTQPVSAALANLLWLNERAAFEESQLDFVAPVPRYWTRRLTQEHHQAETVSRVLSRRLRVPHARTLLHKTRLTPDQSELTATQRKQNLRGAFSVSWFGRHKIEGKTILLVDDILTTGTTVNECSQTLLKAGARQVIVAAIAVVPPIRR